MAKDPIDGGSNINVADRVESTYLSDRPIAYPTVTNINQTIDGDQVTSYSSGNEVEVDLKKIYKLTKLNIKVGGVNSYTLYIGETNTTDPDNVSFTPVTGSTLSGGYITYEPTSSFNCRWIKIEYSATYGATS